MKITIVGCGLIGGSMALALKRRQPDYSIACLDVPERIPAIREAGITDLLGTMDDFSVHIPDSAVVVVATPVQSIPGILERIRPFLHEGAIVTDVGSTKNTIMLEARKILPECVSFIGGHPIAGSERSGVEAAEPLLFSDRVYALCPYPDTPPDALITLLGLVESLLAVPITLDPGEHDRIMAMVSHLPQLIAVALMQAARAGDAEHGMLDKIAGRGFLEMTRLAGSDYSMWKGILETNQDAIQEAVNRFSRTLSKINGALLEADTALAWEQAGRHRRKMLPESLTRPRKHDLRSMIDRHDKQILSALGHRIDIVRKIGKIKMNQATPVVDPDRERRMMLERQEWGQALGLPADLVEELFAVVMKHSSRIQSDGVK